MTTKRRPEHENPPDIFYNDDMASKYAHNTRIRNIQKRMTERAIELLQLPAGVPCHILDVGCGSGLSGEVLESQGHTWVGTDIARSMLRLCKRREWEDSSDDEDEDGGGDEDGSAPDHDEYLGAEEYEAEAEEEEEADAEEDDDEEEGEEDDAASEEWGIDEEMLRFRDGTGDGGSGGDAMDLHLAQQAALRHSSSRNPAHHWAEVMQADMGCGLPFRAGVFDGCVSISALQWLCNVDKKGDVPQRRLMALFQTLYNCLRRGARAVFQFYPENKLQSNMIFRAAMKCGFGGGLLVDFPHSTRARKFFLVIYAGLAPQGYQPPKPLTGRGKGFEDVDEHGADVEGSDAEDEDDEDDEGDDTDVRGGDGKRARNAGRERPSHFQRKRGRRDARPEAGTKAWVMMKKEQRRKFGQETHPDTKYTMRRRKPKF